MTETEQRVVDFLTREARHYPWILKVILFGSRARGDAHPKSDFDVAVMTEGASEEAWTQLTFDWQDAVPTLCDMDLIHFNTLNNPELRASIRQEGKVIYERLE